MDLDAAIRQNVLDAAKLSEPDLARVLPVLRQVQREAANGLDQFLRKVNGEEKYTLQQHRALLVQLGPAINTLEHKLPHAMLNDLIMESKHVSVEALKNIKVQAEAGLKTFGHSVHTLHLHEAGIISDTKHVLMERYANSAARYAGNRGNWVRNQLAVGLVKDETVAQMTKRLLRGGNGEHPPHVHTPPAVKIPKVTKKHEGMVTTVDARALKEYGFWRLPNMDAGKLRNAAKHVSEGQRDPVTVLVSPSGALYVDDGRHRLQAAIDAGKSVKVRWWRGAEIEGVGGEVKIGGPSETQVVAEAKSTGRAWGERVFFNGYYDAERLVRTELINAYGETQVRALEDANREDYGWLKRWDASNDRRTCPWCGELDGNTVAPEDTFYGGYDHPPAHPCCRCAVVAWRKEWPEINTWRASLQAA